MLESNIERYLVCRVKALGGRALKFVSPGHSGVPDRLVCLPGGRAVFVELKAQGKKPRPLQVAEHKELENLGFEVFIIDSKRGVDKFILQQEVEGLCSEEDIQKNWGPISK